MNPTRLALFDLDDTLFDHIFAARRGLQGIQGYLPAFANRPFEALESEYGRLLETVHLRVLSGELTLDEARRERIKSLSSNGGEPLGESEVNDLALRFREGYLGSRRPVEGAIELLEELRRRGVSIGIVTNNIKREQEEKLEVCGLTDLVEFMLTSEEIGTPKPEPPIFTAALERAGRKPSQTVVVGDSWESDVIGARRAALRAVWYNPKNLPRPDSLPVDELRSFRDLDRALEVLLGV